MNTKTVKDIKIYNPFSGKYEYVKPQYATYEEQMPETLLDDMIADWEHDNLESK
jgi:hypothetical protein